METEELEQLGLSSKEAKLYLASLELGKAKAADLASQTGLNRGTVYDLARSLEKHSLLSHVQQGRISYFYALSPEYFIERMNEKILKAKSLLPAIASVMKNKYHRPKTRFYEGVEGIKAIYQETLKCQQKQMLQFVSVKEMLDLVGKEFMLDYVVLRVKKGIGLRSINAKEGEIDDKKEGYSSHTNPGLLRKTRLAPAGINFPSMVMIYDDSVALMSTKKENFGFIIESREFAEMMRALFAVLWQISK